MTKTYNVKAAQFISFIVPVIGFWNRIIVRFPILGKGIIVLSNKMTGKMLPYLSFLGFRKETSYENAVWNWEIFLNLIGAEYEAEEVSPEINVYTIKKCPAGFCSSKHLNACKATMALDHSLVESSGARLIVEKRIPVDGVCIEKIVSA